MTQNEAKAVKAISTTDAWERFVSNVDTIKTSTDGSKNLLPESKWGHAVALLVSGLGLAVADWMGGLDLSALPTWAVATATVGVGTLAGLITSWAKKNR